KAPVLEVKTDNQVVYQSYFGLNHTLMDFEEGIVGEHVTINGVPLYGKRGIATPGESNATIVTNIMHAYLVPGRNKIQVWGVNAAGIQSNRETRYVFFDTVAVKPNLYILGIGASTYKDKDYNLQYAAKDVNDFVELYENNTTYNKINTRILENENVNLEEIKKGLDFLKEAKVYDHVIVYIAGHGVLDDDLDYFLATHDMDFSNPSKKGLNYGFLEDEIGNLTARTRTIFIDACHSGEIDKSELVVSTQTESEVTTSTSFKRGAGISSSGVEQNNVYELMNVLFSDLRNNSGATIIASAGGNEYAYEGAEWKNGVFTYCILKGLKELTADLDNDGSVQLSELQRYVSKEVSSLTNGLQKPTSRFENTNTDYSFWGE
ncbi:MAG: caspase family protein, partial [Bacteroidia bacterium]|nr:caspase family protein [Bacteroidia bacterium]